uniref:Uncharacterized protein n=1 Tax=Amphimedon queenslandica TaxID=400682 RepID=A0A1X7VRJ7_AMPQE
MESHVGTLHPFQYPFCQLDSKFSPDCCFGLLKQKFRTSEVDSLDDFVQVVEQSSVVNKAQLVGSSNGELIVETFDWSSYFATLFKKIKGIKGFQHCCKCELTWFSCSQTSCRWPSHTIQFAERGHSNNGR